MTIKEPSTTTTTAPSSAPSPFSNLAASLGGPFDSVSSPPVAPVTTEANKEMEAAGTYNNAVNQNSVHPAFIQQIIAAQQGQSSQPTGTDNNNVNNINLFAAQMLQQLASPEGRAQFQQIQIKMTEDGRIIPAASKDVVHVYLKDIGPRPPLNLEGIDGNLWSEFSLRMAPIAGQIKKAMYLFMAYGVLSAVLCGITPFVISPFAITGVMMFMGVCFFCAVFVSRKKWKVRNEEVKSICEEFKPRFEMAGYSLEYFHTMGMIVICRVKTRFEIF